jgi:hypothetical protein
MRRLADGFVEKGLLSDEISMTDNTYTVSNVFISHMM